MKGAPMGISPLPAGFPVGQRFGSNPTKNLPDTHWLIQRFGRYQQEGHTGDDYPAPQGTPVYATEDGVVMWAADGNDLPGDNSHDGWVSRWYLDKAHVGNLVAIEHTARGGYTTLSYHLHSITVKPFQKVKKGQQIGTVGTTGRSTGNHVHLDVIPHTYPWSNGLYGRVDPSTYTSEGQRMIWLTDLADKLRAQGLTVVEVPGWKTRGYGGLGFYGVAGVLHHHTATGRAAFARSNAPTLNLLTHGRSDLAGPLCNLAFGRDGTVYVVAAGWANHAGRGSAPGFPRDQGNGWLIGIEAESSGVTPWDWTKDQLRVWPYLAAALEQVYLSNRAASLRLQLGHKEYSSEGKIDPAGISMDQFRASINKIISGKQLGSAATAPARTKEWDEMASKAEIDAAVAAAVRRTLREEYPKIGRDGKPTKSKTSIVRELQWLGQNFEEVRQANKTTHKLLGTIAEAVKPSRIALAVWGYTGKTAHKFANGKLMDAYATLNESLRYTQLDSEQLGSTTTKEAK